MIGIIHKNFNQFYNSFNNILFHGTDDNIKTFISTLKAEMIYAQNDYFNSSLPPRQSRHQNCNARFHVFNVGVDNAILITQGNNPACGKTSLSTDQS